MHESLCAHPDIDSGTLKEIHYFSLYPHRDLSWYASHFENCSSRNCVDASPSYFDFAQGTQIPSMIKSAVPNAKIILIVRDPVARAVSHFFHMKKVVKPDWLKGIEINEFFDQPFENACRQTSAKEWLLYQILWFSCYFRKFQYYRSVFGENSILVLANDRLRRKPGETMYKTFAFLGLENFESPTFSDFKYSTGSSVKYLDSKIYSKLSEFLHPDFEQFKEISGVRCSSERTGN